MSKWNATVTKAKRVEAATELALDYEHQVIGRALVLHADCLEWLSRIPENSLHAIVTDPPYGVK